MIDQEQLAELIKIAFDTFSDTEVEPAVAREQQAQMIAAAVALFVIGRTTAVTGVTSSGDAVTGTGIIG